MIEIHTNDPKTAERARKLGLPVTQYEQDTSATEVVRSAMRRPNLQRIKQIDGARDLGESLRRFSRQYDVMEPASRFGIPLPGSDCPTGKEEERVFYVSPDGGISCNCPEGECAIQEMLATGEPGFADGPEFEGYAQRAGEEGPQPGPPSPMEMEHLQVLELGVEAVMVIEDALQWWLDQCQWSSVHGQVSYFQHRFRKAKDDEGKVVMKGIDAYETDLLGRILLDFANHANVHATLKALARHGSRRLDIG